MTRLLPKFRRVPRRAAALLAVAWAVAGCGEKPGPAPAPAAALPSRAVRVQTVTNQSVILTEDVVGTVQAKTRATLEARISGRITRLPVVVGQRVAADEIVATLDAAEISARLDQARAALEQAERDWKRVSTLFAQQAVTRAEYDAADARLRIATGAATEAKAMLSYVELHAPFAGVVTAKWAETGDLAAPGKPLLAIENPAVLQLEADVPEALAGRVKLAAQLAARVAGLTNVVTAVVSEIAPTADPASRTLRVKLDLPETAGLRSGQFARLSVPSAEGLALEVPASALVVRGQLELCFVVSRQHAQLHLVKTGRRTTDGIEILSGLDSGDAVVIEGAALLTDGQPVEVK